MKEKTTKSTKSKYKTGVTGLSEKKGEEEKKENSKKNKQV